MIMTKGGAQTLSVSEEFSTIAMLPLLSDLAEQDYALTAPNGTEPNGTDECKDVMTPIDIRNPWIARMYIYGFFALVLIGIPSNVLSFIVIQSDRPYSTTRTLLLYLTATDILILLCEFHNFVLKTIYDVHNLNFLEWTEYWDPHIYVLTNITKFVQIWVTVIISADRYYAVCYPFKASQVRTVQNAERAVAVTFLLSIVLNIPRVSNYYRVPVHCYNRTVFKVVQSPTISQYFPAYELVYNSILDPIFYYYVPLGALLVFNTFLTLSVRRANKMRGQMTAHARNEASITATLVAIVSTFIVCETPTVMMFVLNLCTQIVCITDGDEAAAQHACFRIHEEESLLCVSILTLLISSSTNFFLYVVISQKFRGTLMKILCSFAARHSFGLCGKSRSPRHTSLPATENAMVTVKCQTST